MSQRVCECLAAGLFVGGLLTAAPQPASATIVFDDHFDGNSGGMPAGWSLAFGTGSVVEWGTVVDLLYSKVVIVSDSEVDPSVGTVSIVVQIAETKGAAGAGAGFGSGAIQNSHYGMAPTDLSARAFVNPTRRDPAHLFCSPNVKVFDTFARANPEIWFPVLRVAPGGLLPGVSRNARAAGG
jgi:hypothetical protein